MADINQPRRQKTLLNSETLPNGTRTPFSATETPRCLAPPPGRGTISFKYIPGVVAKQKKRFYATKTLRKINSKSAKNKTKNETNSQTKRRLGRQKQQLNQTGRKREALSSPHATPPPPPLLQTRCAVAQRARSLFNSITVPR